MLRIPLISYRRCMGTIALEKRCKVCGGLLGKRARSLCSAECRRLGKAANGRARYERSIGRLVSYTVEYKPRRVHRDGSLTLAVDSGDGVEILAAVRRLSDPAPGGCLLWTRDDVKGFGRFRYQGKDLRVHRVVAQALWGEASGRVLQTCGNRLCCAPAHLVAES
jgi:hypothetical protein